MSYANRLEKRVAESIDLVVVHCTELPDLLTTRAYGEHIHYPESQTGNSGHFYIERNGHIEKWVPVSRVAHHVRGFNQRSIGIELVNRGRFPDWLNSRRQAMTDSYPAPQIQALVRLLLQLNVMLPNLKWIAGHEELDTSRVPATDDPTLLVQRKMDPGPLFPWPAVLREGGLQRYKPG